MIILDTNVISEMMKVTPEKSVAKWLANQKINRLYTTWINVAEIQRGIHRLPNGKRKNKLSTLFIGFVRDAFEERIFSFDEGASLEYAQLGQLREEAGFHLDPVDLMIAAIASANHCKIATRNVSDFQNCNIDIINPWPTTKEN